MICQWRIALCIEFFYYRHCFMLTMKKIRADLLLLERGLAESRSQAQALILAGKVRAQADDVVAKPSQMISLETILQMESAPKFVSRGGEKLEAFLEKFAIDVANVHALDVGASTGGFTDCLLQHGAADVVCVDVGHGQLHYKLQKDSRVRNVERLHAKDISKNNLGRANFDVIVMDLSFISLKKILLHLWSFLSIGGILIALIKPQFEAEKSIMSRCKGVLKDTSLQEELRDEIADFALKHLKNSVLVGVMDSPLLGTRGNREFLMGLRKTASERDLSIAKSTDEEKLS
jgi:23S rRNA (cytidine1920-2'-O)/16S rRNA (cytidine1409-2'-O)-methyltransferase